MMVDTQRDTALEAEEQERDAIAGDTSEEGSMGVVLTERYFINLICMLATSISGAAFLSLCIQSAGVVEMPLAVAALAAVSTVVCLLVARFNDRLIEPGGFKMLFAASAVFFAAGTVLYFVDWRFLALAGVGCLLLMLLSTNFLVTQTHFFLNIILLCVFLIVGSVIILCLSVQMNVISAGIGATFAITALVCAYISRTRYESTVTSFLPREESRTRLKARKSNFTKNFADGICLGFSFLLLIKDLAKMDLSFMLVGAIVALAATITCLFRYIPNLRYENFMNWHMILIFAVCFLAHPLLTGAAAVVASSVAFFCALCFILILVAAMSEFSKTVRISCFYEFGIDGAYCFIGLFAGAATVPIAWGISMATGAESSLVQLIVCDVIVALLTYLNIDIVKGGYPHPEEFGSGKERRMSPRHGASWRARVDMVAQRYGLSPRQAEVLQLLARGRNATFITDELRISKATAKSHIYSIYQKTGVHTQQELIDLIEAEEVDS